MRLSNCHPDVIIQPEREKIIKVKVIEVEQVNFNIETAKPFDARFKTAKDKVLSILRNDELARKDDFYLCLLFWIKSNQIKLIVPLDKIFYLNKPETISRARRSLIRQAKKGEPNLQFLLKDKETLEKREEERQEVSNYFSAESYSELGRSVK